MQSAGVLSAKASAEPYWKRGLSKRKPEEYQRGVLDANAQAKGYWNTAATAKAVMTGLSFAQLDEKIDTAALAANSPSACAKANCARSDAYPHESFFPSTAHDNVGFAEMEAHVPIHVAVPQSSPRYAHAVSQRIIVISDGHSTVSADCFALQKIRYADGNKFAKD